MSYDRNSKPKVAQLTIELIDIVDDWETFAIQLPEITKTHLNTARHDYPNNIKNQKLRIYQTWLEVYPQATWDDVVDALNKTELVAKANSLQKILTPVQAGNINVHG